MVVEDLDPDVVLVIAPQSTFRDPERNWPSSMRLICDRDVLPIGNGTKRERENLTAFELGVRGVYACTPQFFTRADVSLWSGDLAIVDECFVAGTTVETPLGPRNIEDLRAGDEVWGFDHTTGRVTLTHVRGTMEKVATNVTPSGATVNHPYYVPGAGYLPLGDLTREDRVLAFDRESVSGVREVVFPGFDSPQPGVLLPPLCGQEARNRLNSNGGAGVSGVRSSIYCQALGEETNLLGGVCRSTTSAKSALGAGRTHLRGVRGHVSGTTKRGEEDVFPGVPVSPTKCDNERKPGSTRGKAPKTFVRKNDPEQSNVDARSEREGSGLLSRSRLFAPQGGQWSRVTNRVSTLATVARGVASGYHRYYRRVGSSRPVPQSLQVGHGNTGTSLGRGGGRAEPQFLGAPGTGRAKGASPYSDGGC